MKDRSARQDNNFFASETVQHALLLLIGAAVIGLVFRKLQYSTQAVCCGDYDGYYHIKWSRLLWEGIRAGHFPPSFDWLPLTTLNPKDYVDHHLFFHFLQMPFTWFADLRTGAKISAWLYASLAVFSCYWLIIRYRVRYPLIWLVAILASSGPFLYRLNMTKAPPVAIIFTVIGIYLIFEKKYLLLLPLAFIFVWTYSLFVILTGMAVIWTCVIAWSERRFEWRPLAWTAVGTVAGLVINPYFPKNIRLFIEHVVIKATVSGFSTDVGQEWYPYDSWYLLGSCLIAFAAMIVGYAFHDSSDRRRAARSLFFLFFSTILMLASFRSRRWVEYWPPFAVLFAAFSLKALLEGARERVASLPTDVLDELEPYLDKHEPPGIIEEEWRRSFWGETEVALVGIALGLAGYFVLKELYYVNVRTIYTFKVVIVLVLGLLGVAAYVLWRRNLMKTFAAVATALLVVTLNFNVRETRKSIEGDSPPDHYEASLTWIRENVPPGETVFNTDWDDFPKMFYYDTRHAYVSGLDPTYLLDRDKQLRRDPSLAEVYKKITLGEEKDPRRSYATSSARATSSRTTKTFTTASSTTPCRAAGSTRFTSTASSAKTAFLCARVIWPRSSRGHRQSWINGLSPPEAAASSRVRRATSPAQTFRVFASTSPSTKTWTAMSCACATRRASRHKTMLKKKLVMGKAMKNRRKKISRQK